jgi:hypothetical protein
MSVQKGVISFYRLHFSVVLHIGCIVQCAKPAPVGRAENRSFTDAYSRLSTAVHLKPRNRMNSWHYIHVSQPASRYRMRLRDNGDLGILLFELFSQHLFVAVLDEMTVRVDQEHGRPSTNTIDVRTFSLTTRTGNGNFLPAQTSLTRGTTRSSKASIVLAFSSSVLQMERISNRS